MNMINRWQRLPYRALIRRSSYAVLGTVLTVFYAQLVHAQTPVSPAIVQNPYSLETILAAILGAVITVFFLRGMYLVLTYASETYELEDDDDSLDSEENNALLYGAFAWIVGSAIVIASYGWGWQFLYIGPIVCLLGPLVPIFAMTGDIKKYRQALTRRRNAYRGDY